MSDWVNESYMAMREQRRLDDVAGALIRQSIEHAEGYRINRDPRYRARIMMMAGDMEKSLGLPRNIAVQHAIRFCVIDDLIIAGALDADRLGR